MASQEGRERERESGWQASERASNALLRSSLSSPSSARSLPLSSLFTSTPLRTSHVARTPTSHSLPPFLPRTLTLPNGGREGALRRKKRRADKALLRWFSAVEKEGGREAGLTLPFSPTKTMMKVAGRRKGGRTDGRDEGGIIGRGRDRTHHLHRERRRALPPSLRPALVMEESERAKSRESGRKRKQRTR